MNKYSIEGNFLDNFKHVLRVMRITLFFLFFSILLSQAANSFSQETEFTLHLKSTTIKEVCKELEKKSDYRFVFAGNASETAEKRVNIAVNSQNITEILNNLLSNTDLSYRILDNQVVIYSDRNKKVESGKEKTLSEQAAQQQKKQITGRVVDIQGVPIIGANVIENGTSNGTVTDLDGNFTMQVNQDVSEIRISYIGYITQNINTKGKNSFQITLQEDTQVFEEVVVTGYQTLSKERATGSYGIITTKNIETKLQSDLSSMLEGQATGVVLDKNGKIEIRGVSTFNAEKTPLIVVDNFPIEGGLETINPENIENITVLKDGVAASIYGSRAANGVIVVTTTKGRKDAFNVSYKGILSTVLKPKLSALNRASTSDYIDAELDIFEQDPNYPSTTDRRGMGKVTWLMMQVREGKISREQAMSEINELRKVNGLQQAEDAFFRNQLSYQHNLSINGGTEKNQFNTSINYLDNKSAFIHSHNSRLIFDIKNNWNPRENISFGVIANVVYQKRNKPTRDWSNLLQYSSRSYIQPYDNLFDPNTGEPATIFSTPPYKISNYEVIPGVKDWTYNPIENLNKENIKSEDIQTRIGGNVHIKIIEGLSAEVGGIWTKGNRIEKTTYDADSYTMRIAYNDATSKKNYANHYIPEGAMVDEWRNTNESWTVRSQLNFNRAFNDEKHWVTVLLGNEIRQQKYDNNELASRVGYNPIAGSFTPINIKDYNMGLYDSDMIFGSRYVISRLKTGQYALRDFRFVSWYGNSSYEYDNRYLLSGSIRLDLTNFFGTDPKYRYNPLWSVGGTWKVSEEDFFNSSWINRWNLRASYGINGNISLNEGPFMILSVGSFSYMTQGVSYGVASPPNNQLRWEKTQTTNLGTDLSLLNNRINLTLDYYHKNSTDLLANDAIDPTTGFSSVTRNAGKIVNQGIEFSINTDVIKRNNFLWNTVFNLSFNKNTVKKFNVTRSYASSYTGPPINVEGYAADGLFGYRFAGLNNYGQAQGYAADGEIKMLANLKPEDIVYLGTVRPKYDLSFTNAFKYKDIQLSFMLIAKLGHKYRKDGFYGTNYQNRHVVNRWKESGDEETKNYPVLQAGSSDSFYFPYTDFLIGNASYMKLRDLTVAYNMPYEWLKTIGLNQAKIYFQARNLLTIVAKDVDIDPEISEYNPVKSVSDFTEQGFTSLPLRPEFYFGLSFSF